MGPWVYGWREGTYPHVCLDILIHPMNRVNFSLAVLLNLRLLPPILSIHTYNAGTTKLPCESTRINNHFCVQAGWPYQLFLLKNDGKTTAWTFKWRENGRARLSEFRRTVPHVPGFRLLALRRMARCPLLKAQRRILTGFPEAVLRSLYCVLSDLWMWKYPTC